MRWPGYLCAAVAFAGASATGARAQLEVLPVQGNVYALVGPGGNTTIQVGHEGVVVVDAQTADAAADVIAATARLSPKPIRFIINTSADAAHTGGNEVLSRAGTYVRLIDSFDPRGASSNAGIVAHVNVLTRLSAPPDAATAAPSGAWPSDTYFTAEWALFVNGEAVQLLHIPAAHSDGDTMVFFRRSDVLSTGDIFSPSAYPSFDRDRGGSIAGVLEGLNRILDITIPGENQEGGTVVVPGHGRLSDETDVANYRDMVTIVRDRIAALIAAGMTLEQVQAAKPTSDYDGIYAAGPDDGPRFVARVYRDLVGEEP
jgi:glyoxylase-like metal-dependent hydrolase (beta-lactamase superfamily II)